MKAMILAAGRGERLRPLTDATPKALVEVAGATLLEQHLARLRDAGIRDVIINVDWLGEQIIDRVGDGRQFGLNVVYSPEFGNVLETAGGIQRALPLLGNDPFWVINSDVFTDAALPEITLPDEIDAHLLLVPTPKFKQVGDFDLRDGLIRNAEAPELTFSGIACYRPRFFADLAPGRSPLVPLFRVAADDGRLSGGMLPGSWEDVGTPERLENLQQRKS